MRLVGLDRQGDAPQVVHDTVVAAASAMAAVVGVLLVEVGGWPGWALLAASAAGCVALTLRGWHRGDGDRTVWWRVACCGGFGVWAAWASAADGAGWPLVTLAVLASAMAVTTPLFAEPRTAPGAGAPPPPAPDVRGLVDVVARAVASRSRRARSCGRKCHPLVSGAGYLL